MPLYESLFALGKFKVHPAEAYFDKMKGHAGHQVFHANENQEDEPPCLRATCAMRSVCLAITMHPEEIQGGMSFCMCAPRGSWSAVHAGEAAISSTWVDRNDGCDRCVGFKPVWLFVEVSRIGYASCGIVRRIELRIFRAKTVAYQSVQALCPGVPKR